MAKAIQASSLTEEGFTISTEEVLEVGSEPTKAS